MLRVFLFVIFIIFLNFNAFVFPANKDNTISIIEFGKNAGRGNLLGIQSNLENINYSSEEAFYQEMKRYLEEAKNKNFLNNKTIAIYPETIGMWLAAVNENKSIYSKINTKDAMMPVIIKNLSHFLINAACAKEKDRYIAAIFKLKSKQMAKIYNNTFSTLAKKYGITIVAGSIVLSDPYVDEYGSLITGDGGLYNISVVYKPDGKPYSWVVYKQHPTIEEESFIAPSPFTRVPIFDTPAGKLAVLICADSFFEQSYEPFKGKNVNLIAVPSHNSNIEVWKMPHIPNPHDPDDMKDNINNGKILTEKNTWLKYSMTARAPKVGIKYGLNIFMTGSCWKAKDNAYAIVYEKDNCPQTPHHKGAALINLWLK